MNAKRILIIGMALFSMLFGAVAMSEQRTHQHIQIAEIDVDLVLECQVGAAANQKAAPPESLASLVGWEPARQAVIPVPPALCR